MRSRSVFSSVIITAALSLLSAVAAASLDVASLLVGGDGTARWGVIVAGDLRLACLAFRVTGSTSAVYNQWESGVECRTEWTLAAQRAGPHTVRDSCAPETSFSVTLQEAETSPPSNDTASTTQIWAPTPPTSAARFLGANCSERQELVTLYQGTNGAHWLNGAGWVHWNDHVLDIDHCRWTGVGCDAAGKVTMLSLYEQNMRGDVTPLFASHARIGAAWTELTELDLASNDLTGALPADFGVLEWPQLEVLHLGIVNLHDVDTINRLGGELGPQWGAAWRRVRDIDLGYNANFGPSISAGWGRNWARLGRLVLENCRLGGALRADFGDSWPLLDELRLSGNSFALPLPRGFGDAWSRLRMLWFSRNGDATSASGVGGGGSHQHAASARSSLPHPALQSALPSLDADFGRSWSRVEIIDLSRSGFGGSIPAAFGANWAAIEQLTLAHNGDLTIIDAAIGGNWSRLETLDLSHTHLGVGAGNSETWLARLSGYGGDSVFDSPALSGLNAKWPRLVELKLGTCGLHGTVPLGFGREWRDLRRLYLDGNDLAGPLPELFGATWPLLSHLALNGNRMLQYIPNPPFGLDSWKLLTCEIQGVALQCPISPWILSTPGCSVPSNHSCTAAPVPSTVTATLVLRLRLDSRAFNAGTGALVAPSRFALAANMSAQATDAIAHVLVLGKWLTHDSAWRINATAAVCVLGIDRCDAYSKRYASLLVEIAAAAVPNSTLAIAMPRPLGGDLSATALGTRLLLLASDQSSGAPLAAMLEHHFEVGGANVAVLDQAAIPTLRLHIGMMQCPSGVVQPQCPPGSPTLRPNQPVSGDSDSQWWFPFWSSNGSFEMFVASSSALVFLLALAIGVCLYCAGCRATASITSMTQSEREGHVDVSWTPVRQLDGNGNDRDDDAPPSPPRDGQSVQRSDSDKAAHACEYEMVPVSRHSEIDRDE